MQDVYANTSIKRLSFDDGNLIIAQADGSVEQITLSDIARLSFKDYVSAPTRVEQVESSDLMNLKCYPNPTESELNIEMAESDSEASVNVLTMSGQTVISQNNSYTNSLMTINVSDLKAGMYILRVSTTEGIQTTTFIKQ